MSKMSKAQAKRLYVEGARITLERHTSSWVRLKDIEDDFETFWHRFVAPDEKELPS